MVKISGKTQGILYIIIAAFGFAGMSLFVKLAGDLPSLQKAFFRNFVALIYISIIIHIVKIVIQFHLSSLTASRPIAYY